jgi:hypothetical protein
VWQSDFEYVNKDVSEYNDFIIDLRSKGIDPSNMDPSLMRKMKELEANIRRTTAVAKDNETYSNQSFNTLNQDKANKYNKEHASNWLKEYADPNKTPQERAKMRTESNPFKINYNMIDFIDNTIPKEEVVDKGRLKITSRNKEAHRGLVLDFIMNDPSGQDVFESLKKDGEDEMAFAERVSQEGQKRYPSKEDRQVPAGGGGSRSSSDGGSRSSSDDVLITGQTKETNPKWDQSYSVNKIALGKTKPVYVYTDPTYDEKGNLIDSKPVMNFVPADGFYLKPGGAVAAVGYGVDENGKQIKVEVDYDKNKGNFDAQGYPNVFDEFRTRTGGGGSQPASGGMSLAEQMRANAGGATGQKKNVINTPAQQQPTQTANTVTAKAAGTGAIKTPTTNTQTPASNQQKAGASSSDDWTDEWTKYILKHERDYGAPGGVGFGEGRYSDSEWTGKNTPKMSEYVDKVKSQVPNYSSLPDEVKVRLVDYKFNTGRNARDLVLLAAGEITLDEINSKDPEIAKKINEKWSKFDQDKVKESGFAQKIDAAKKQIYKTTKSGDADFKGNYDKNWSVRTDMWNNYTF